MPAVLQRRGDDMDRLAQLNDDMLPFAKLLGIHFVIAESDRVVAEFVLRGGGLAPLVVVVLALGVWVCSSEPLFGVAWLWAVLLLGYVSFRDDQGEVPIQRRLAVQIFVSVGVLFAMAGSTPSAWQLALAVFVLVAFTNYVNFMDGINGLVPGQLILMSVGSALLCGTAEWESGVPVIFALVLAGALTGFLPFNFPSPKMFMGDIGSVSLGFSFGVLIFWMAVLGQDKDLGYSLLPLTAYFFFGRECGHFASNVAEREMVATASRTFLSAPS